MYDEYATSAAAESSKNANLTATSRIRQILDPVFILVSLASCRSPKAANHAAFFFRTTFFFAFFLAVFFFFFFFAASCRRSDVVLML